MKHTPKHRKQLHPFEFPVVDFDFSCPVSNQNQTENHQQETSALLELLAESNGTKLSPSTVVGPLFIRYSIVCYRSGCIDTSDIAQSSTVSNKQLDFQDALEPENFSTNLLDHFMITYGLSEVDVYAFVALNVICFPSGWCFNPDDVGNICCPF
uniref:Uncharacterized protein n=1 Tax=Anopheles maculatus TaxID=74869 RepID=A0A182SQZ7_9DIPT